jgi:REP element-mobilizing transposase RayT
LDRFWLLTWTTYGSWLPGDARGFVSEQTDTNGRKFIRNIPGTEVDCDNKRLRDAMAASLKGPPLKLSREQAHLVLAQFSETSGVRGYQLLAASVMANHVHLVVGVPGDPEPSKLLAVFKSYASRALNRQFGAPASRTWWTESGSKRKLPNDDAILAATRYVRDQQFPLATWLDPQIAVDLPGERET